jgi:F0F1-type ATP synthase assembly protein I
VAYALSTFSIVIVAFFIGLSIDKRYGTLPLFTIFLVFLGIIGSIYSVLKKK